jgi:nucleoside-diphosphate-sugar epimerase
MSTHTDQILVTGSHGWLGKRLIRVIVERSLDLELVRELPPKLRIRGLVLPGEDATELLALGVEVMQGDLRNPGDCARFCEGAKGAVLLHTAGIIHPNRVGEFYEVNVKGTRNILDAAVAAQVRRAVMVSSNSPIGLNPHSGHLFDESSPYRPYMNYGKSKMQMELAVEEVGRSGRIETVIVRPPWFYGVHQPPRQTLFFSMIREGKAPIVGSGNNLRSMAYVDNLCEGVLLAAYVERACGGVYWIADKRPYSMNEIVDTVERLLEEDFKLTVAHKRIRLPGLVSEVAMLADGTLQALGLYSQKIHVLSEMNKNIACSVARAEAELGYKPRVALEEGMRRSIESCLQRGITI